jgi:GAF domain-containing protein
VADERLTPALEALIAWARRVSIAQQLDGGVEDALLRTIVEATARLFDAEAASIALFEREPDRLEFRVAAGEQGPRAVGLSVAPSQGIAGYVFSTGQPLALSDVAADPRFDRATAERTGYVPRSIAAVPLLDGDQSVGVLQVLDKRGSASFSMRDMELLAAFAAQAAAAIAATRVQRDATRLLRAILSGAGDRAIPEEDLDVLVASLVAQLEEDRRPFWRLVESLNGIRSLDERESEFVAELLAVATRYAERKRRR